MRKYIFCYVIIALLSFGNNYTSFGNNIEHAIISAKIGEDPFFKQAKAYYHYREGDYKEALGIYHEIYGFNKDNAKLNFMMAKCYFQLRDMDAAIEYLLKVKKLNPKFNNEIYLLLGEAYQYQGNYDAAIKEYNIYESLLKSSQFKNNPVINLLSQAETAKELMKSPVNTKIKNLGTDINSEFDDGVPNITADGKTLYFSSKRPNTKAGGIDVNTGNYFDDVYFSTWNETEKKWNPAKNAGGNLNTPGGHDDCLGLSSDGSIIFIYRNIKGVTGSGDIYFSTKKADGKWDTLKPIGKPINSSYFEGSCTLSPDKNTLYFVSERKGGYGNADIWKSKRIINNSNLKNQKSEWSTPVNLGPVINTNGDEMDVFMHPDGKTLFFSSNGHNTMGGYDIFMTQMLSDSTWSEPLNLGYPINSIKNELSFTMTQDGKKAFITSDRDNGSGGADIYEVDLSKYIFPYPVKGQYQGKDEAPSDNTTAIINESTLEPNAALQFEDNGISVKDLATKKEVTQLFSNENGDFFVTLKGNNEYEIVVNKPGYKKYTEKIILPFNNAKINTLIKIIMLEKK